MSDFNTLYRGSTAEVLDVLEGDNPPSDIRGLLAALTNAMRKIDVMEKRLELLDKKVPVEAWEQDGSFHCPVCSYPVFIPEMEAQAEPIDQSERNLEMVERIAELEKDRDHWKANHDNLAAKLRLFTQREDLPVDRLPAYRYVVELERQRDELLAACEAAKKWLEGWASAEPYLSIINQAIAKAKGGAA